jgi:hypothetical protein
VHALATVTYNWLSPNMRREKTLTDVLYIYITRQLKNPLTKITLIKVENRISSE